MVKIAAVQLNIIRRKDQDEANCAANMAAMETYIKQCAADKVDIVVFPEYAAQGPIVPESQLWDREKKHLNHFVALAKQYQIDIVPGSFGEIDPADGKLYNVTYYIDKDGKVLIEYRKVHLWHPERPYTSTGNAFPTAMTRFGIQVGLLICWDTGFNDGFSSMALDQGAQLIIAPSYWGYADGGAEGMKRNKMCEVNFINNVTAARAFEYEICFVYVNGANDVAEPLETRLIGRSQMSVPFHGTVARCEHDVEDMIVAEIDIKDLIDTAEQCYLIRKDHKEAHEA
ncbi:carbon-nitrogen hydrolase [Gongronella butleri]|nr:carbon-nitrogen hydrolase [Gongronella butleri]